MTDHAHALLRLAQAAISELLDRLEASEADALEQARLNGIGAEKDSSTERSEMTYEAWRISYQSSEQAARAAYEECAQLRARVEAMEQQEPVGRAFLCVRCSTPFDGEHCCPACGNHTATEETVYAIPGAQPTPSIPEGWLRAIDEALVVTHIGVANASDTYEQAKVKLDSLIGFHVDVATDPAANGGWKPIPEKHPIFQFVDLRLADGSVLCGCIPQSGGGYWWKAPRGEVFIDPKHAPATHWRLDADPEAKP